VRVTGVAARVKDTVSEFLDLFILWEGKRWRIHILRGLSNRTGGRIEENDVI